MALPMPETRRTESLRFLLIRQIQPDLLITDIKMPFMDGLALSELVRKELPRTKIVIISGYDDFSYAQQAIRMGVEQYLLKPVIKEKMVDLLISLQKKMEAEQKQREYLSMFQREAQEYEAFSRRAVFEQIVTGRPERLPKFPKPAKAMEIDLNAAGYNILLFSLSSAQYDGSAPEGYIERAGKAAGLCHAIFFSYRAELILFRWNITTHAVLVKGGAEEIISRTAECVWGIQAFCEEAGCEVNWHVACGSPVSRLSALPACSFRRRAVSCPIVISVRRSTSSPRRAYNPSAPRARRRRSRASRRFDQERVHCFFSNASAAEMQAIASAIIGGTLLTGGVGNVVGTLFGVLSLKTINNIVIASGLREPYWQSITTGLMLCFFILLQSVILTIREGSVRRD